MHDVPYLLASLSARGISVDLDGEALSYRARQGPLGAADRDLLKAHKAEIVDYLRVRAAASKREVAAGADGPVPASLIQRVWVRLMTNPYAAGMEKLPLVLSYNGVSPATAEAAVRSLFARHDALRARLGEDMTVRLNPPEALAVRVERLADKAAFEAAVAEVVDPPLPLSGEWLARAAVLEQADGTVSIVLLFHHFICDGASLATIMREINAGFAGLAPRQPAVRYSDYARGEAEWAAGEAGAVLARYMRERLEAIPVLHGPSGRPLTWVAGRKVYRPLDLPAEASRRIAAAAAALKTTPFVVIAGAYALALASWSGQDRFAIRVVGDQRTSHTLAELVGMMTVTDILDIRVPDSLAELLARVAAESDSAMTVRLPAQPGPGGWHDWREHTGATINYTPFIAAELPPPGVEFAAPPYLAEAAEVRLKTQSEPIPAAPVFLRLIDGEAGLGGRFEFNEPLVTPDEQAALILGFRAALDRVIAAAA
jgi:hypothetical protein